MGYNIPNKISHFLFFLWGEFYVMTFRNTLFSTFIGDEDGGVLTPPMNMEQNVPKRLHIKFRRRGHTQKKDTTFRTRRKFGIKKIRIVLFILTENLKYTP